MDIIRYILISNLRRNLYELRTALKSVALNGSNRKIGMCSEVEKRVAWMGPNVNV